MADEVVHYELREAVAILRMDDGKANALSPTAISQLTAALDRAEGEAQAVLWIGRPGRFSAGFDLSVMRSSVEAMRSLVIQGADLYARMLTHPKPIVAACTGHALAAGALALLASDARLGSEGDFKIGLNEVAIGMPLPVFGVELARARLSKRHFVRAVSHAEIYDPGSAVDAGYLDEVVAADALESAAFSRAQSLGALSDQAFAITKQRTVDDLADRVRATARSELGS